MTNLAVLPMPKWFGKCDLFDRGCKSVVVPPEVIHDQIKGISIERLNFSAHRIGVKSLERIHRNLITVDIQQNLLQFFWCRESFAVWHYAY